MLNQLELYEIDRIDFDYQAPKVEFKISQVNKVLFAVQSNRFHNVYLMCSIWICSILYAEHPINSSSILLVPF